MIEPADTQLVCQFIVIDHLLKFLDQELKSVEQSNIKLKKPHVNFIHAKIKKVHQELQKLNGQLRKRQIKIYDMEMDSLHFCYNYYFTCRGFDKIQPMSKDALRGRVIEKLKELY